jgi:hypothetical protein
MSRDRTFLDRLRTELNENDASRAAEEHRHPVRRSRQYQAFKGEASVEVDALCERLVRELKSGIAEIDRTIGSIAEPLDDQLARGAVSDVFEAAAEILKAQARGNSNGST